MNKRVLMLAPLMGLLLTSCGRQWKEINKEEFFKMRSDVMDNISIPNSFKIYYEGNKATVLGVEIKDIGLKSAYDINKKFYQSSTEDYKPTYYVPYNNTLWRLYYTNGVNAKEQFQGEIGEVFNEKCGGLAKNMLTANFSDTPLYEIISFLDLAILNKTSGTIEYKFYSSGKDSIKFSYKFNNAMFDIPISAVRNDTTKFTGGEEYVIENGLPSYIRCYGNTYRDVATYITTGELTQTNFTLRYQHNCKIDIPAEANPDTWCA